MEKTIPVKALFIDIGGVLLTDGWGHQFRKRDANVFNLDLHEMDKRHQMTLETYELGKLTLKEYLDLVVFYQPRAFSQTAFRKFMFNQSKPYPEMIELIRRLKEKYALKIVVVNNEGRELNDFRIQKFKLYEFVDFFISSCFVNLRKPDTEIYKLALDTTHLHARNVVYVDNTPMFTQIAEGLKIRSILHTDYLTTCAKLASFGLNGTDLSNTLSDE